MTRHVILRLVVGLLCTRFDRPRHRSIEVIDCDVEMAHHLLITLRRRPQGAHIDLLLLEREPGAAMRRLEHHPVGVWLLE